MLAAKRKFLCKTLNDELRLREAAIPPDELLTRHIFNVIVRLEIVEIAVAITLGHARTRERAFRTVARGAIARNRPNHFWFAYGRPLGLGRRCKHLRALRGPFDHFPTAALTQWTICPRNNRSISARRIKRKQTLLCKICGVWK